MQRVHTQDHELDGELSPPWRARRRAIPGIVVLIALSVPALVVKNIALDPTWALTVIAGLFGVVLTASRIVRSHPPRGLLASFSAGLAVSAVAVLAVHIATTGMTDGLEASNWWTYTAIGCGCVGVIVALYGLLAWSRPPAGRYPQLVGAGLGLLTGCMTMLSVATTLLESK